MRARTVKAGDQRGRVTGDEAERLRRNLGGQIKIERGRLTARELAELARVSRSTVEGLEMGNRRPTMTMCWRLANALARHQGRDDLAAAAIAARLADAAGPSLRHYSARPQRRRERLLADAREAARDSTTGVPVADGDTVSLVGATAIARLLGQGPDGQS